MKNLLLYGPPASGKSTIAKKICSIWNLEYISVGKITRTEIEKKSAIGKELKNYLDLVVEYPVELITTVVFLAINKCINSGKFFILDGYPKYDWEAREFLKQKKHFDIAGSIILEIPFETAKIRSKNRRVCPKCQESQSIGSIENQCLFCNTSLILREDDSEAIFIRRYNDYITNIDKTMNVLRNEKIPELRINSSNNIKQIVKSIQLFILKESNA